MSDPLEVLRRHSSRAAREFGVLETPPLWARGEGATLWDERGVDYIDFTSGSAVSNAGHGNQAIRQAIEAQLATGVFHTGTLVPSPQKARVIERIVSLAPPGLTRVHLASTGGEAVEVALKAVRYATGRQNVIAFWGGYHGRPMGALALTGFRSYRDPFYPVNIGAHHFAYPYPYRNPFGLPKEREEDILRLTLAYLEQALDNPASGLAPVAAIFVEPVQGVGGMVVPPAGFLRGLRALCDRFGLLLVSDEIFCGFGRTGAWFGCQREGVTPDVMIVSKGLSGTLPVAGIVGTEAVMTAWPGGTQSSTFEGNPIACAAAVASVDFLVQQDILGNVRRTEDQIRAWSQQIAGLPFVGEVRGVGAMWGIEIVEPGTTRPAPELAKTLQSRCFEGGALVYRAGHYGNVLGLLPPLVATEQELATGLARATVVLADAAAGARHPLSAGG
ncbi:MAG: aspartate aminotransferase family protein [Chloroflexi bacterium]|nr:aspartate aminotransferase family protein [Chloroflexota bacterium]